MCVVPDIHFGQATAAGAFIGAGVIVGLAMRVILRLLVRKAGDTRWSWDDVLVGLLAKLAVPLCVLAGLWGAVQVVTLPDHTHQLAGKLLAAVTITVVTLSSAATAATVIRMVAQSRAGISQSATIFVNITRALVVVIGLLIVLESLGISITPLITALGVGGLAVALALQDTLANLFAGVQILASRKVQPGDYVRLDSGDEGYIVDINWRNTQIRQLAGNMVLVPNARFADAIMINYHRPQQDMSVLVQVGVAYGSDLDLVERVTIEVGKDVMTTVTGGVVDHQPFIRFHTFADSSVNFSVILRGCEFTDQYLIKHEFIKRLHARYRIEGIEIPFPIRTVVMPHGAPAPAVPAQAEPMAD